LWGWRSPRSALGNAVGALAATSKGVSAAVVSILISFISIPVYLTVLRKRDEKNLETSGMTLSLIAMTIALVVFAVVCCILLGVCGA
jgi:amino acid transporter